MTARAQLSVTFTAIINVNFLSFDRANEIDAWRVERSSDLPDVLPERPARDSEFSV